LIFTQYVYIGWSAVMPWGICQRTCCSRKSKAKLSKKFAPKGVPLMPSTLDNDVDNLMKFLGPILLRSIRFSIKNDEENTLNSGKFLIRIKNKIKRSNSVGQKVNTSNLQPSNSKKGKHNQTLDEQDGNPIFTDKLPIDNDPFENSPSGPEKEKLADKIIRKF